MSGSLLVDIQAVLVTMALMAPRAMTCLIMMPASNFRTMHGLLRNAVAISLTLPAAVPTFDFVQRTPPDFLTAGMLIVKEAAFGGLLGVLMSIPLWVVQSVGSVFDMQRSPIQIQGNNSSLGQDASALGSLLVQAVVLVMINAGLFVAFARIIIESYAAWPAFSLTPPFEQGHYEELIRRLGHFFWYVVVYGAPVIIPLIMVEFAFALVGVFASNLQVSFASAPVKSLLGLFIALLYWETFSYYVAGDFAHMLDIVADLTGATRHGAAP